MLLEALQWLFVFIGGVGILASAAFLVLLFASIGQGFWIAIRLADDPKYDQIQFHFMMNRMHQLTCVFYTGFVCIIIAKVLQYCLRDSLE